MNHSPERKAAVNSNLTIVDKPSPFPRFFSLPDSSEMGKLDQMNQGWNRWTATRYLNPFIKDQSATGFEGYYIGLGLEPTAVAAKIAELGSMTIRSLHMLHRNDSSYFSRLWKVAKGEIYDRKILEELNTCLLANIARLRTQILPQKNLVGDEFRNKIIDMVKGEEVHYLGENGLVQKHEIAIPLEKVSRQKNVITVDEHTFSTDKLREGYAFMQLLGKAGYPLVQLAIRK